MASILRPEFGPVNSYNAPLNLDGRPLRFPWQTDLLRKVSIASLNSKYALTFIQITNRYWEEPVGYSRARPLARGQEYLDHHIQHLGYARVHR